MSRGDFTRRELLRRAGAAAGVAAVASTAGCSAMPCIAGFGGCGGAYRQWLPEPGTVGSGDHYRFTNWNLSSVEQHEDEFRDDFGFDGTEDQWAPADIDWEDVSMALWFNGLIVVESGFNQDDIVSDFEDDDWDDETTHEGYEVMLSPNEAAAVGVGGGTLVAAGLAYSGFQDPVDVVEDVVDTKKGNEDRYVDESDDFAALTDKLGSGDFVSGGTMEETDTDDPENGQFENMVARGSRWTVNGSTTKTRMVMVFEDGDDVDTGDVEDWIDENDGSDERFDGWDDVNVNKNGRAAVINGTVDTDEL